MIIEKSPHHVGLLNHESQQHELAVHRQGIEKPLQARVFAVAQLTVVAFQVRAKHLMHTRTLTRVVAEDVTRQILRVCIQEGGELDWLPRG
ncbi:hypothetical protein D3C81_1730980 [compost metagenome]